jgi:hypothetical protein
VIAIPVVSLFLCFAISVSRGDQISFGYPDCFFCEFVFPCYFLDFIDKLLQQSTAEIGLLVEFVLWDEFVDVRLLGEIKIHNLATITIKTT